MPKHRLTSKIRAIFDMLQALSEVEMLDIVPQSQFYQALALSKYFEIKLIWQRAMRARRCFARARSNQGRFFALVDIGRLGKIPSDESSQQQPKDEAQLGLFVLKEFHGRLPFIVCPSFRAVVMEHGMPHFEAD